MFCQECGFKNEESKEGMFCESCGAKLEVTTKRSSSLSAFEDPGSNPIGVDIVGKLKSIDFKKIKSLNKRAKTLIIIASSLLIVIVVLLGMGSAISSPERVVKAYFESYISADFEKAYSYLSFPESKFLNKQSFSDYMKRELVSAMDVANYEIIDPSDGRISVDESQITKVYQIDYVLRGESSKKSLYVNLVLQDKNRFVFFKNYKIGLDDLIVRDYIVYAPEGVNLSFDGIALTQQPNITEYYPNLKMFVVDAAFRGKHILAASSELYEDNSQEVVLDGRGSFVLSELELKKDIRTALATNTYNVFVAMVQNAIKKGDLLAVENIADILTSNPEQLKRIQEQYNSLTSSVINDDGTGLKSVSFKSFSDKTYGNSLDQNGQYLCDIQFNYSYVKTIKDWWTDELTEESSSYERDGSVRFSFAFEEGKWKIVSFDSYNLYY